MIQDGYDRVRAISGPSYAVNLSAECLWQYKGSPFKVANINRWMVVVSGQKFVEELRNADDDVLSFMEAATEVLLELLVTTDMTT